MPGNAGGSERCDAACLVEQLSCAGAGKIGIAVIVGAELMAREWTTFCDENATGGSPHSSLFATDWMGSLRYIAVCTRSYTTKGLALERSWGKPELPPEVNPMRYKDGQLRLCLPMARVWAASSLMGRRRPLSHRVNPVAFRVCMQLSQGKLELTDWNGNAAALASAKIGCDYASIDKTVRRFGRRLKTDVGLPRNIES